MDAWITGNACFFLTSLCSSTIFVVKCVRFRWQAQKRLQKRHPRSKLVCSRSWRNMSVWQGSRLSHSCHTLCIVPTQEGNRRCRRVWLQWRDGIDGAEKKCNCSLIFIIICFWYKENYKMHEEFILGFLFLKKNLID